jgi:hypothetical protein
MMRANNSSRTISGRRTSVTLAALVRWVCAIALLPGGIAAAQTILITEPVVWRAGQPLTVTTQRSVRIAGSVMHPAGVARVLINGKEATTRPAQDDPEFIEFERTFPADSLTAEMAVAIVAKDGQRFEKRYSVVLPAGRTTIASTTTSTVGQQGNNIPIIRPNPWGPFRLRGVGYGAAAVAGIAMAMVSKSTSSVVCSNNAQGLDCVNRTEVSRSYQGVGFGLAGVSAAAFLFDAAMTSKRAGALRNTTASAGTRGAVALEPPAVVGSPNGPVLALLRLSLR